MEERGGAQGQDALPASPAASEKGQPVKQQELATGLLSFAHAFPAQREDLRVLHQAVGNGRRDANLQQDIDPLGEGSGS